MLTVDRVGEHPRSVMQANEEGARRTGPATLITRKGATSGWHCRFMEIAACLLRFLLTEHLLLSATVTSRLTHEETIEPRRVSKTGNIYIHLEGLARSSGAPYGVRVLYHQHFVAKRLLCVCFCFTHLLSRS